MPMASRNAVVSVSWDVPYGDRGPGANEPGAVPNPAVRTRDGAPAGRDADGAWRRPARNGQEGAQGEGTGEGEGEGEGAGHGKRQARVKLNNGNATKTHTHTHGTGTATNPVWEPGSGLRARCPWPAGRAPCGPGQLAAPAPGGSKAAARWRCGGLAQRRTSGTCLHNGRQRHAVNHQPPAQRQRRLCAGPEQAHSTPSTRQCSIAAHCAAAPTTDASAQTAGGCRRRNGPLAVNAATQKCTVHDTHLLGAASGEVRRGGDADHSLHSCAGQGEGNACGTLFN